MTKALVRCPRRRKMKEGQESGGESRGETTQIWEAGSESRDLVGDGTARGGQRGTGLFSRNRPSLWKATLPAAQGNVFL